MSENLQKILNLEIELGELIEDKIDTTDIRCEEIVFSISNLLKKVSESFAN